MEFLFIVVAIIGAAWVIKGFLPSKDEKVSAIRAQLENILAEETRISGETRWNILTGMKELWHLLPQTKENQIKWRIINEELAKLDSIAKISRSPSKITPEVQEIIDTPEVQGLIAANKIMLAMSVDGVDADELPNGIGEFGLSPNNPIPCETILGSIIYLESLRTSNGDKVLNKRIGSFNSNIISHPVDGYEIFDLNGQKIAVIFISPYQKRNSEKAPKGFKIVK